MYQYPLQSKLTFFIPSDLLSLKWCYYRFGTGKWERHCLLSPGACTWERGWYYKWWGWNGRGTFSVEQWVCNLIASCCNLIFYVIGGEKDPLHAIVINPPPLCEPPTVSHLLYRLDSAWRPGLTSTQFRGIFSLCSCGIAVTRRRLQSHSCRNVTSCDDSLPFDEPEFTWMYRCLDGHGLHRELFEKMFARCICGLVMTRQKFHLHECSAWVLTSLMIMYILICFYSWRSIHFDLVRNTGATHV